MLSSLCCVTILLLAAETGPHLSDAEFFGAMDPNRAVDGLGPGRSPAAGLARRTQGLC